MKPAPPSDVRDFSTFHNPKGDGLAHFGFDPDLRELQSWFAVCPYGQPGDRLWVRESIFLSTETNRHHYSATRLVGSGVDYEAEPPPSMGLPAKSIPSIHMPRWASRIALEITGVRVERLHDISEADAVAEGVAPLADPGAVFSPAKSAYCDLWEAINGPGSWFLNPWVWVVEFKVVKP